MIKRHLTLPIRLGVAMTAVAMVTAGCGGSGAGGAEDDKTVSMGVIPGWTDQSATTYILKNVLEDNGYTVEITELNDNAPMYTALSKGDIDVLSSAWPELTHKKYMEQYGKNLEDLGIFFEGATSFLAVPDYMDISSIEELPAHADELDGTITGIEPGAGLTGLTKDSVMPAYGLDKDFELQLSSTPAMLTALEKATKAKEPIVITMWKPFWANLTFPIKALEDPKGAFGEPENLHVLARGGFSEDKPEVAEMMKSFELTEEQFGTIEGMIVNDYEQGEEEQAAADWLKENPEFAEELASHLK